MITVQPSLHAYPKKPDVSMVAIREQGGLNAGLIALQVAGYSKAYQRKFYKEHTVGKSRVHHSTTLMTLLSKWFTLVD